MTFFHFRVYGNTIRGCHHDNPYRLYKNIMNFYLANKIYYKYHL